MHVIVVGAGLVGLCIAQRLALRGVRVTVVDARRPAAGASGAAAGMLGAQLESVRSVAQLEGLAPEDPRIERVRLQFQQRVAARALWRSEAARFAADGLDVGYRSLGAWELAFDDAERASLLQVAAWHRAWGGTAEWRSAEALVHANPTTKGPNALGGLFFADEAQVEPRRAVHALCTWLERAALGHVALCWSTRVTGLAQRGDRIQGVTVEGSSLPLEADAVVLAPGAMLDSIAGLQALLPDPGLRVQPIRGQMFEAEVLLEPPSVVAHASTYVVPRGDGRVTVGSTMESVGHDDSVDVRLQAELEASARRVWPALEHGRVTRRWAGLRPRLLRAQQLDTHAHGVADSLQDAAPPYVGRAAVDGLYLAVGHHRNGVLLCFASADLMTHAIVGAAAER